MTAHKTSILLKTVHLYLCFAENIFCLISIFFSVTVLIKGESIGIGRGYIHCHHERSSIRYTVMFYLRNRGCTELEIEKVHSVYAPLNP